MKQIDLIHDTRHLYMHIKSDMIKAMSHPGISGRKIKLKVIAVKFIIFSQIKTMILVWKMYKIIEFLRTVSDDIYIHLAIVEVQLYTLLAPVDNTIHWLTNRFHVATRLFSKQMTSNCGKNKEVAHEP